jgi:hypothetical protein
VDSNSGTNRSLSENLLASVIHNVAIASGDEPNMAFSSDGVHRSFANLLTSLKRFNQTVEVKGGFKGLEMTAGGGSVPFLWERDCPENQVFLLNTDHLVEFQMSRLGLDGQGRRDPQPCQQHRRLRGRVV